VFYAKHDPPINEPLERVVITDLPTNLVGEVGSNVRRPTLHAVRVADLVVPAGVVLGVLVLPRERAWANDADPAESGLYPLDLLLDLL